MPPPLTGLRVLDLSRILAGPWAAQLLGDLGADVVKVERPGVGDDTRTWGPPWTTSPDGDWRAASYYFAANRNKRGLALDLQSPAGADVIRRLAARADVLIENFKVGDLARAGLDHASLSRLNPRLIYCSVTGFGQDGPNAHRAGYDFMIQAQAGLMSITGEPDGRPLRVGVAVADITTGLYAATAILAALRHRDATGEGQHLDLALFDTQLGWLANQGSAYLLAGVTAGRSGNGHPSIVPYQDFACADRHIAVAVGNDRQFRAFAQVLGRPNWGQDPAYARGPARVANRAALVAAVADILAARPAAEWLAAFDAAGVPAGPVNSIAQAFADPQVAARGLVVETDHPKLGTIRSVAHPAKFSATPPAYTRAPPMLGQHSREVLREAGYDDTEIAALEAAGVVEQCADNSSGAKA